MHVYALLVGVNDYAPDVGPLRGAVNDVAGYESFLRAHFDSARLDIERLIDADATRQNIIAAFRQFLGRAGPDDVALFQYAGHGARWKSAASFRTFFPDGFDEGLICHDSRRRDDAWDLADKELAILLAELSRNNPHLVVILDACHSASATRSADDMRHFRARASHTVQRERPLDSYLDGWYESLRKKGEGLIPPGSRHILLAACDRHGQAYESTAARGVFSETLLETLEQAGANISYAELFMKVRSRIRRFAYTQIPQFEARQGFSAWQGFLNRIAAIRRPRFAVRYVDWQGWRSECGAIHGLPVNAETPVELTLYHAEAPGQPLGIARTTGISLTESEIEISGFDPDRKTVYQAELCSLPDPGLVVFLSGDSRAVELLCEVANDDPSRPCSLETEIAEGLAYAVRASADGYEIRHSTDNRLIQRVVGVTRPAAEYVCSVLHRIAAWERAVHLRNPDNDGGSGDVEFFIEELRDGGSRRHDGPEVTFDIVPAGNAWSTITAEIRAQNRTDQRLNLMLVWFSGQYGIQVLYNEVHDRDPETFTLQLDTGDDIYEQITLSLEEEEGNHAVQTLMLIVSREKVDDFLLEQEPLETGETVTEFSAPSRTRGINFRKKIKEVTWFTRKIELHLVRRGAQTGDGTDAVLAGGTIRVLGHESLKSSVSVLPLDSVSRGSPVGHFARLLTDRGFEAVNLEQSRGETHCVLEFRNVEGRDSLADSPLEIEFETSLDDDEYLLPVVHDGEHLWLAGDICKTESGATRVSVRQMPDECAGGRSAWSAFRMYLLKAICGFGHVDRLYSYERLNDGRIARSSAGLGERVARAREIVILVHGLAGDSASMAEQWYQAFPASAAQPPFDLVLGFDYESVNTPIEETATGFRELLRTRGIADGCGKRITIVAHSLGGLVARWMIERDQGNSFVSHLVMCGTPNEGAPLGTIAVAPAALTNLINLALDALPELAKAPLKALQNILKHTALTTTLSQLYEHSEFLRKLNTSDDPGVRYTILAGDAGAYEAPGTPPGRFARWMQAAGKSAKLGALFGQAPHDVAVSVDSARAVLESRSPAPQKSTLACHHLNYLSSATGIDCLKTVNWAGGD